jgi:hypothetical protein
VRKCSPALRPAPTAPCADTSTREYVERLQKAHLRLSGLHQQTARLRLDGLSADPAEPLGPGVPMAGPDAPPEASLAKIQSIIQDFSASLAQLGQKRELGAPDAMSLISDGLSGSIAGSDVGDPELLASEHVGDE